jgi:predicted metal-dependent hydrolase
VNGIPRGYDEKYVQFLHHFNVTRDYFECHEVMEELWMEEGRSLLCQGLLQIAVGLYHYRNDNVSGAIKLLQGGIAKLSPYPADVWGIDLGKLLGDARQYLGKLEQLGQSPFDFYDLNISILDTELAAMVDRVIAE